MNNEEFRVLNPSLELLGSGKPGHGGQLSGLAFCPNGRLLVTTSDEDRTARVWDTNSGSVLHIFDDRPRHPKHFPAFDPSGSRILIINLDDSAELRDARTGDLLHLLRLDSDGGGVNGVRHGSFSPDGRQVVTGHEFGAPKLWNSGTGELEYDFGLGGFPCGRAEFSPDGRWVLNLCGWAVLYNIDPNGTAPQISTEDDVVDAVFSSDSRRLATAHYEGKIVISDLVSGGQILQTAGHAAGSYVSLAFIQNDRRLVSIGDDGKAHVWNAETASHILAVEQVTFPGAVSADGRRLCAPSDNDTARVMDVETGRCLHVLEGHAGKVQHVAFSSCGRLVATASADMTARLWDTATGALSHCLEGDPRAGHSNGIRTGIFSPDSEYALTGSQDRTVRLWRARDGDLVHILKGHRGPIRHCTFSPDGRFIVTASEDATARIWETGTGYLAHELRGHRWHVLHTTFSPDSTLVATASGDSTGRIWDTATGQLQTLLEGHKSYFAAYSADADERPPGEFATVSSIAFSPDGQTLVTTAEDRTARVWDAASGETLLILGVGRFGPELLSAEYSPDGRYILTGDHSSLIWPREEGELARVIRKWPSLAAARLVAGRKRIMSYAGGQSFSGSAETGRAFVWDAASGELVRRLRTGDYHFYGSDASADGRWVATTGDLYAPHWCTPELWNIETGPPPLRLKGHEAKVNQIRFSPDGTQLLTMDDEGRALLWNL